MKQTLLNLPIATKSSEKLNWGQIPMGARSLSLAETAIKSNALIVSVCSDPLITYQLQEELTFFLADYPNIPVLHFPDQETLPYDVFSPHQDIISARLFTLYQLAHLKRGILLVSAATALQYTLPRGYLDAHSFILTHGQHLDSEVLRHRLESAGYRHVGQVMEHGEYTIRGSIIDLFPMGSPLPLRIDRFSDEVDSIRTFDPDTQLSLETIDEIKLLPAREYPLTEEAITRFRQNWRAHFSGNPMNSPIYEAISSGNTAPGIEYYLPLFYEKLSTFFDYLPDSALVIEIGDLASTLENFWHEITERYEERRHDITRPLLPPQALYLRVSAFFEQMNQYPRITLSSKTKNTIKVNSFTPELPDLHINRREKHPFSALSHFLETSTTRILFCAQSAGRRESLLDLLKTIQVSPKIYHTWQTFLEDDASVGIMIMPLTTGFGLTHPSITLLTESELFGEQTSPSGRRAATKLQDPETLIRDLIELTPGSPVVHVDHGIGRYLGLEIIKIDDLETEFLTLEYAGGDKLYVPVSSLHLINRFSGPGSDKIALNKLGTEQWAKVKRKAAEQIHDVAAELLELYAKRAIKNEEASIYAKPNENYAAFASAFPFEVTPDQAKAIIDVIADLQAPKIMDRLICGDVGFGKTEVAMRAAFVAIENNKQVAVLVPTTLLAQQHYESFKDRFADWPVRIEVLSRFRSTKEQNSLLTQLDEGKIDIVIGTHRLLQKDVHFKNLGLLIIDEEHRFGVQQKEKIKALRTEVDMLALTATPIPRTLNMALAGMRDLSIIYTPPAKRLAIKTFVHEYETSLLREAILREIHRGGQVFYLHNSVDTIERMQKTLQQLVPEARFIFAHGQMHARELEHVMSDFYHQRFNVLICTTIIENGIDIPSANTIIIERADKFGLAQLHQLRGRVGRSHHQAYAYLLVPSKETLTPEASKRLDAIASLEDLGAGFMLASHDLEIRGAGELLGQEQSGHMQEIGFSLYMEMLEQAIKTLKEGKEVDLSQPIYHGTEVDIRVPALIPQDYIPDIHTRLIFYKRIANAKNNEQLKNLMIEMIDRFGLLKQQTKNLFQITEIKLCLEPIGVKKLEVNPKQGLLEFTDKTLIKAEKLVTLLLQKPQQYKLMGSNRLRLYLPTHTQAGNLLDILQTMLQEIEDAAC